MIAEALRQAGGNRAEAARRLGIHRQLLYTKARRYGLIRSSSRPRSDAVSSRSRRLSAASFSRSH
ncbi:MAG: helix-turn-helix domain-containing protein [Geminicoccaceae bacterium]